jgi:DNA primase
MFEEKRSVAQWEIQTYLCKTKKVIRFQYVSETIISFREYLINKLIVDLMSASFSSEEEFDLEELKNKHKRL